MTDIVTYEQLQDLLGGATPAEVAARAAARNVPTIPGKRGRPFTTVLALNSAMGLLSPENNRSAATEVEIL